MDESAILGSVTVCYEIHDGEPWLNFLRKDGGSKTYKLAEMQHVGISEWIKRYDGFVIFFHTKVCRDLGCFQLIMQSEPRA